MQPVSLYGRMTWRMDLLPHPETVRQYEDVLPGSAERIMSLAETNSARHHEQLKIGQYIGATVALSSILGGGSVVALSNSWPAVVFGVLTIAIGVGIPATTQAFVENFSEKTEAVK